MCGIVGIYDTRQRPVDGAILRRMTEVLGHRGPDDVGIWVDREIGFGHQRLAIRDLSEAGHQPMADRDGLVTVTFNGEIYNDADLRQRLTREHGCVFSSTCDTEVIPAGYVAWGSSLFGMLEGMFAIALWDSRDRSLTLARDGAGIKPLFLSRSGTEVSFASEIKALLQNPRQGRAINDGALHTFFATGYAGPVATTLAGIEQVPPGTARRIDQSGISDRRFWQPARTPDIFRLSDALDAFGPLWKAVTAEMLVSDVPVGVLQSGGIDSSLVTMAVRGHEPKPRLFTAGYAESTHDETDLAGTVARLSGLPHEVVPMGEDARPAETFAAVVYHTDGQLADSSAYSTYRLFAVMRRHLKVVLAGDGADEFFGGYPTYRASRVAGFAGSVAPKADWTASSQREIKKERTRKLWLARLRELAR